ncbi:MAG: hypothetical protein J0J01_16020 [Reyranella sp.]|uniref:hypothetical protein n=1 Tax=Reyranella sp. TaxID=1929291 RepID=UPI001AC822F9|nr:hypothetical protein [Reyranella sp.]MBN9088413.1 hypothetical protein [Reyranella sp.]
MHRDGSGVRWMTAPAASLLVLAVAVILWTTSEDRMAVTGIDTRAELLAHRRTFASFERLPLFAAMHIAFTLSCLALAFLGNVPVIALLLGVGGTFALIAGFVVTGTNSGS